MATNNAIQTISNSELAEGTMFTERHVELIKDQIMPNANSDDLMLFIQVSSHRGLDPFMKHIYAVQYGGKWSYQVSIDGLRLIAQRSGRYRGQTEPQWCGPDGQWVDVWLKDEPPAAARVGVWIEGNPQPLMAVALYKNFVATDRNGNPNSFWKKMPDHMLAKCFDDHTEVLTDRGFQKFSAVTGKVLQVTPDGLEPTDSRPFAQDYFGDMITLESDDLNFSVTPNHDMVTDQGKIEAGDMFDQARARPKFRIPRSVQGSKTGIDVPDHLIRLAAMYIADGYDRPGETFAIAVSRDSKIEAIRELGIAFRETIQEHAGAQAHTATRIITSTKDKVKFHFAWKQVEAICDRGKRIKTDVLMRMSRGQARLFVDTLVEMDGHQQQATGVRRFYTSRLDHLEAFETAAVIAGYAVSPRRTRYSDISTNPNYYVTISDRDEIPVIRWGRGEDSRSKGNESGRTGLEITKNSTGKVWCVTVPSGEIVVRRAGFSMICGNCAEAQALRKAFPEDAGGLYTSDEMGQAQSDRPYVDADGVIEGTARPANRPSAQVKELTSLEKAKVKLWDLATKTIGWNQEQLTAVGHKLTGSPLGEADEERLVFIHDELLKLDDEGLDQLLASATSEQAA